ncbi:outer membrane efflux protein [Flavobacterium cauense R2A-7]|nr:TolC family protein [Flavobacterium cauense]ESU18859.1 outer membrane efflux protein [Flavobacterium cauense R2A-7]
MKTVLLIAPFFMLQFAHSQRNITLKECDDALQKNNLLAIAGQYNITASKAAVIQARIWEQPFISAEINALNPDANRTFDIGQNGQKALAIQQLIYLGGKKRNEIKVAKSNAELAELQFEQLISNLKFELRQSFYSVYFDQKKLTSLASQSEQIETLLKSNEIQAEKGNIPLKDVVRLQSLLLNLKNDKIAVQKDVTFQKQNLALLTGIAEPINPIVDETKIIDDYTIPKYSEEELLKLAKEKNPEYLISLKQVETQEATVKLQKSLSIPDVTTGFSYDQNGGAFHNQVNFTLGIPLPLWNKNKGNIKIAQAQLGEIKANSDYKTLELQEQIRSSFALWKEQKLQYTSLSKSINQNLDAVYQGVLQNFLKRNISLFEFTDFMESYNQSTLQLNEMRKQFILSSEELNHIVNTTIF